MSDIQQLIEISRQYGNDPAYVIAGGGNTSFKDEERIWIKASGIPLEGISETGFVCLSRGKLGEIEENTYSEDSVLRGHPRVEFRTRIRSQDMKSSGL